MFLYVGVNPNTGSLRFGLLKGRDEAEVAEKLPKNRDGWVEMIGPENEIMQISWPELLAGARVVRAKST